MRVRCYEQPLCLDQVLIYGAQFPILTRNWPHGKQLLPLQQLNNQWHLTLRTTVMSLSRGRFEIQSGTPSLQRLCKFGCQTSRQSAAAQPTRHMARYKHCPKDSFASGHVPFISAAAAACQLPPSSLQSTICVKSVPEQPPQFINAALTAVKDHRESQFKFAVHSAPHDFRRQFPAAMLLATCSRWPKYLHPRRSQPRRRHACRCRRPAILAAGPIHNARARLRAGLTIADSASPPGCCCCLLPARCSSAAAGFAALPPEWRVPSLPAAPDKLIRTSAAYVAQRSPASDF